MGRGTQTVVELASAPRRSPSLSTARLLVEKLDLKVSRALAKHDYDNGAAILNAAERAVGVIPEFEQRQLIAAATLYEGPQAERIRSKARELLLFAHSGAIAEMARKNSRGNLEEEALRQVCREAVLGAIDRYDPDNGANFLTYAKGRMLGAIKVARTEGHSISFSSSGADQLERVRTAIALLEREHEAVTVEAISYWTSVPEKQVAVLLPYATGSVISLDQRAGEEGSSLADLIGDEDPNLDEIDQQSDEARDPISELHQALATLSPPQRYVLEQTNGLRGEKRLQSDLYDGLYLDAAGNAYTHERSVVNSCRSAARPVTVRSRRELLPKLRKGELRFEPSTAACEALYKMLSEAEGVVTAPSKEIVSALNESARRELTRSLFLAHGREAELAAAPPAKTPRESGEKVHVHRRSDGRRVTIADLTRAGVVGEEKLVAHMPRSDKTAVAHLTADGQVRMPDGRIVKSLSKAAQIVTESQGWPGWDFWHVERDGKLVPLAQLRDRAFNSAA